MNDKRILCEADEHLPAELRYFEAEPSGHSALERHQHVHAVLVLRGKGSVLLHDTIYPVAAQDTVYIPPQTWHQFHADADSALGFLCLVAADRDRPTRATPEEVEVLRRNPAIHDWLRV